MSEDKTILLTGASGYVGTRMLHALGEAGYNIIAVVRNKARINPALRDSLADRLTIIEADLTCDTLPPIEVELYAAYYLLHSMNSGDDFHNAEVNCAKNFLAWVAAAGCRQIVYLGAILPVGDSLSAHLESREEVRRILSSSDIPLTVLRASIIIGSGSASFEIIRDLVEKLPFMITPKWVRTECQPISIRNVIYYLCHCINEPECLGADLDIGGSEQIGYVELLTGYAKVRGLRRILIPVPVFSAKLSSHWLNLITAINFSLAKTLVGSLHMKTVCRNMDICKIIPQELLSPEEAIEQALAKIAQNRVPSAWYDSLMNGKLSHNQLQNVNVPEHGVYFEKHEAKLLASKEEVLKAIWSIGGNNGWPAMNWAWKLRGLIDKLIGGIGFRRGRKHPQELYFGEILDFWRVLLVDEEAGRLVLYAEMKLPGEAWLEFSIGRETLVQTATFRPKGVWGRLYWTAMSPFHKYIFNTMVKRLANGWPMRKSELEKGVQG